MKIKIGEYEVNISAKYCKHEKANKQDTLAILCELSSIYFEASEHNKKLGCYAIQKEYKEKADSLYNYIKDKGLF